MIKFFSFRFLYRMLGTFMSSVRKFAAQWKRTTLGAFTVRKKKIYCDGFLMHIFTCQSNQLNGQEYTI